MNSLSLLISLVPLCTVLLVGVGLLRLAALIAGRRQVRWSECWLYSGYLLVFALVCGVWTLSKDGGAVALLAWFFGQVVFCPLFFRKRLRNSDGSSVSMLGIFLFSITYFALVVCEFSVLYLIAILLSPSAR
jgi:hypothetical protein